MRIALLFDISGGEFLVIMLFVLIFFGAKGVPDIARGAGRFLRQVRDASNEVQREINRGASEVRRAAAEHQRQVRGMVEEPPDQAVPTQEPQVPEKP
ncbi:MAG: twin-arginine translocase TatA/TatE family subunit [Flavobacteriales bacterium]|jgi:sec-independent protein translocase protein TatA|nr:twin-arginine translocase TatA/TatE family subunit [Flavobacteriales bacterium]